MSADGSIRTAAGSSRKRRRMSPDDVASSDTKPTAAGLEMKPPVNGNTHTHDASSSTPCHHEQSLRAIHGDLDAMRQLITCSICQRFMYEPYALSCGHTYCYSCLAEWMGKNHKKSCPDCRNHVRQEPTPAYLIKEMVLIFVNRVQLLPDGETSEEHHKLAKEEKAIVDKDRADTDERQGGLFKGTFSRPEPRPLMAVHDPSDHVDRCPSCLHEVEDGWCLSCHVRVRNSFADPDDESTGSLDIDGTDDGEDTDLSEELDLDMGAQNMTHQYFGPAGLRIYSDEEDEDEFSEDEDQDLSGFVEDEVRFESDADEPDYSFEAGEFDSPQAQGQRRSFYSPEPQGQRRAPIVVSDVSDSEEAESEDDGARGGQHAINRQYDGHRSYRAVDRRSAPSSAHARLPPDSEDDDEEEEEDDEDPVPTTSQRGQRRTNRYITVSSEGEEDDEEEPEEESDLQSNSAAPSDDESEGTTRPGDGGFSPLQYAFSPANAGPFYSESSAPDSEAGSIEERSDDEEDNETDEMDTEAPGSEDEDEHSEGTGYDD